MSQLDPATLDGDTPRTLDGREYPEHLRAYQRFDEQLLPLVDRLAPATFDDLSRQIDDPRILAALPLWLSSAQWRGLIQAGDGKPRVYELGPKARIVAAVA